MADSDHIANILLNRRRFLFGAAAAAALVPFGPAQAVSSERLLARGIRRLGGRAVLDQVRLLSWQGEAAVHAGGRDVRIGVSTTVVPFVAARGESWPLAAGRSAARTLVIDETGGRVERAGTYQILPEALVVHERAQFAIYGLMLLAPLAEGRAGLRRLGSKRGLDVLLVSHPKAPKTKLYFEPDGRLAEATNEVPDPETGRPIPQRFIFSEEQMRGPVRWPKTLRIEQAGKPYFEMTLRRFEALL